MDCRIFHVHADVNACDRAQGCMDTVRESALKVDGEKNALPVTGESNMCRQHAGQMLYQLNYIPQNYMATHKSWM